MWRKIRIIVAAVFFVLTTLLFLDFTGALHNWFGWLAKVQFLPALLALNFGVVLLLILLTVVFGRVYCSVLCPLGVFQDLVSRIAAKRKKNRFRYSSAIFWLRYGVLGLLVIALIAGVSLLVSVLDPYSAYGRIASTLVAPLYQWGNNGLALLAERMDSYAFYTVDVWLASVFPLAVAIVTLIVVAILSWRNGRTYCNTICPVGTMLGLLARCSIFRPTFDAEKCTKCGLCERNCKASCIDSKRLSIDHSRCVTCLNCMEKCNFNAIKYVPRYVRWTKTNRKTESTTPHAPDEESVSRRGFLSITALFALTNTLKAQEKVADGGLAVIVDKKIPDRETPIVPPGAQSARHFTRHCTACQLCVSACPNQVLHPSGKLATLMQPEMLYERGYCRPECTRCTEVCPTGAIHRVTPAEKSAIQIGRAVWIRDNCVVNTDEVTCTNCERHCPTGAITLVARDPEYSDSLRIPVIDNERCIGCGACENLCPARPFSAIYVEGNVMHRTV